MTATVPRIGIGSEFPLSFATQSVLGTPTAAPTFAIDQTENTLRYNTSAHVIDTAVGSRASEAEGAQGRIMLEGGFGCTLRTVNVRPLLEAHLGTVVAGVGTETLTPTQPKLLTIFDDFSGEVSAYQDSMLDELRMSCRNQVEWQMAWTCKGGLRTVQATTVVIPAPPMTGRTLAWADTTVTGLGATVPCQLSNMEITIANNVVQWFGSGTHAACALTGGKFSIRLQFEVLYDDANSAAIEADYAAGTHLGTVTVTISDGGTDVHVLSIPNLYLVTCEPQRPLADMQRLRVTAASLDAGTFSWVLPSA